MLTEIFFIAQLPMNQIVVIECCKKYVLQHKKVAKKFGC